ncbi:hypothetical protein MLD38_007462 [Melastoma candidum]|uniref:Uncharacterized protein n=1 Tax=Melastoma candidum TaxID=119954 RepID=A0ACB9RQP5_9MYRT|nr:hypothetical protein MLD38_007462 [Melastoma candidum]
MGNSLLCFTRGDSVEVVDTSRSPVPPHSSFSKSTGFFRSSFSSREKDGAKLEEEESVREQARVALMLLKQYQRDGQFQYGRSASAVYRSQSYRKDKQGLPRSSASLRKLSRDHHSLDLTQSMASIADEVKTNHFILVHGGGFGAWCWFKTMTLLAEGGFRVEAVDLTGSGIQSSDLNGVKSIAEYVKPLVELLNKLGDGEKAILVGHDLGGVCLSHVMELYPTKIAKAIFVAAAMLMNGQSALDMFSQEECSGLLLQQARTFLYADGDGKPPTAIEFNKASLTDLLFDQCSTKDVMLASVLMRPVPFGPIMEKLSLSETKYGSVRRFYIVAQEDHAIPTALQEAMVKADAPEAVFHIKGADHSPFFSKPQALHRLLVDIARIP